MIKITSKIHERRQNVARRLLECPSESQERREKAHCEFTLSLDGNGHSLADNSQLFSRRINAAIELPELAGEHVHVLERVGVDGMSADESDHELIGTGIPHFRIRKKYGATSDLG